MAALAIKKRNMKKLQSSEWIWLQHVVRGTWLVAIISEITTVSLAVLWLTASEPEPIRSQSKLPLNPFGISNRLWPEALLRGLKIPLQFLNDVCNLPYRNFYLIHSLVHRGLLTTHERRGFKIPLLLLL